MARALPIAFAAALACDPGVQTLTVEGSDMGNLPTARTITLVPGDPVPSNLLNELQDIAVADARQLFYRQLVPVAWKATGTAPTFVDNPAGTPVAVWKLPTAQTVRARLPYEVADSISVVDFEVYGDAAVDWTGALKFNALMDGTGGGTIASNGGGVTNETAAWKFQNLTVSPVGPLPIGGAMYVEFVISGGVQLYLASVRLGITR